MWVDYCHWDKYCMMLCWGKQWQTILWDECGDLSESNYSKGETIAILKWVVPLRESLLHFDHVCPSSEAREHHHCACFLCWCWCWEQGEPLDHQTSLSSFFYFKWQCLYNTRNLKPSLLTAQWGLPHTPTSPASHLRCSGTPNPPSREPERGHTEASVVGEGKRGSDAARQRGSRHAASLLLFEWHKWNSHQVQRDQKADDSVSGRV